MTLVEHGDELLDVGFVELDVFEEWDGVETQRATSRVDGGVVDVGAWNGFSDVAESEPVGEKYGHVLQHGLLLTCGEIQGDGLDERLLGERCRALQTFKVVNLVARVLIDDEEILSLIHI